MSKTELKRMAVQNPIGIAEEMHKLQAENTALKAQVNELREALESCLDDSREVLDNYLQIYSETYKPHRLEHQRKVIADAEQALSRTPEQSLAGHDKKVRKDALEEAAKLAECGKDGWYSLTADEIRNLS